MTAQQSHHGLPKLGIGKLVRRARANLHWLAIVLWAVAIMAALAPLI